MASCPLFSPFAPVLSPFPSCPPLVPFCPPRVPFCPLGPPLSPHRAQQQPPLGPGATILDAMIAASLMSHPPTVTHPLVTLQGRFLELGPRSAEDAKFWPYLDPAGRGKQKCEARLLHLCFPILPIGKGGGPVTEHQAIEPRCDLQRLARLPQHVSPPARIHIRACVLLPPQPS